MTMSRTVKRGEFRKTALKHFTAAADGTEKKTAARKTPEKARSKKRDGGKKRRAPLIASIAAAAVLLCAAGVYIYGCLSVSADKILKGVYIEDIDVGGLTKDAALLKIGGSALMADRSVTLSCGAYSISVNCADAGLSPKLEDTVDKAMRYGKSGDFFYDGFINTVLIFKKHTIVPDAEADETLLRSVIADFGNSIYGELAEHSLEAAEGYVVCTPGRSGFDGNTDIAFNQVMAGLKNNLSSIPIDLEEGHPTPLTVSAVNDFTYREPSDAYYKKVDGSVVVNEEVYGRYINLSETESLLADFREGGEAVYIPYYTTEPAMTAARLGEKLFSAEIAGYSTSYGTSSANRCANIANAAAKINETQLMPGEVFSFNETVGPRSAANGFYAAKEYLNGDTVDGIGGGVCQVTSTLYNAVLYSDLSIVSRTNHMFPVDYCPIGQDATVADTGVDFKFVNSMNYPIKIRAYTGGYTVTVSIIGTQRDDPRTVQIQNTSAQVGADTSVHSVRRVYNSAGELIQTDDLGNSYYMAHK